jgi:hypothetical protein
VDWFHKDDPENIGRGDYLDWYCSGPDGIVSDYIAETMRSKGWRYEAENICIPPDAFPREISDKLNEAEHEAASGVKRLSDAEVFDGLLEELDAIPDGG